MEIERTHPCYTKVTLGMLIFVVRNSFRVLTVSAVFNSFIGVDELL